jgi:hypothetical protein
MRKTEWIKLRLHPAEKQAFEQASSLAGVALSAWVRERLRSAARRELTDAGEQVPFLQAPQETS